MPGGGHSASAISTIATDTQHQVKTYTADNGNAHRPAGPHAHYNKVRARRFAIIAKLCYDIGDVMNKCIIVHLNRYYVISSLVFQKL